MALKFVVVAALVAMARAGAIGVAAPAAAVSYSSISHAPAAYSSPVHAQYAAPALTYAAPAITKVAYAAPIAKTVVAEPYAPPHYSYGYGVSDPHTGDSKSQQETREGDVVHGSYSLIEADGSKRIVEYTADDHNGFNAVVHREPAAAPVVTKVAAPIAYAAPITKIAAPAVAYAAQGYYH